MLFFYSSAKVNPIRTFARRVGEHPNIIKAVYREWYQDKLGAAGPVHNVQQLKIFVHYGKKQLIPATTPGVGATRIGYLHDPWAGTSRSPSTC